MNAHEVFAKLKAEWLSLAQNADAEGLSSQEADAPSARGLAGVGLVGASQPCVFVESAHHLAVGRKFARQVAGKACDVQVLGSLSVSPIAPQESWGARNAFPGEVVGGKSFRREDTDGLSGGTLTLPLETTSGDTVALGNLHCFAPQEGTKAPKRHFELLEVTPQGEAFADVTMWKQMTTDHRAWPNQIDAGIARIRDDWIARTKLHSVNGFAPVKRAGRASVGDAVVKQGATTGVTRGNVVSVSFTGRIAYRWKGAEGRSFIVSDCVVVGGTTQKPFGMPGDSGSPVLRETKEGTEIVGVHFAGGGGHGIYCPIQPVLAQFGLEMEGDDEDGFRSDA